MNTPESLIHQYRHGIGRYNETQCAPLLQDDGKSVVLLPAGFVYGVTKVSKRWYVAALQEDGAPSMRIGKGFDTREEAENARDVLTGVKRVKWTVGEMLMVAFGWGLALAGAAMVGIWLVGA